MQVLKLNAAEPIMTPVNHVFVVDVSYSMVHALPKIRSHLKAKLTSIVKPTDTVSIIYFSDTGKCGVVDTGVSVTDQQSFVSLCGKIDKFLHPIGCTSFVPPLKLAVDTVNSLNNGKMNSLIFETDGYDN